MKQLICRDLWLCRKRIAPYIAIVLIFLVPVSMTILSARFGNIAKYRGEDSAKILDAIALLGPFLGILAICSIETVASLNKSDHLSGWYKYLKASGLRSSLIVGQKYIDVIVIFVISWLIGVSGNLFLGALAGRKSADIGLMCVAMGVTLIYLEYNIMIGFATKGKRSDLLMALPMLVIMGISIPWSVYAGGHKEFTEQLIEKAKLIIGNRSLLCIAAFVTVVLFSVLNYLLSVYFFDKEKKIKRKEENR